jgi:hypothetical protein
VKLRDAKGGSHGQKVKGIQTSSTIPKHTAVFGNTVILNIGGQSPDWVIEAAKSREGLRKLYELFVRGIGEYEEDGDGN